MKYKKLSNFKKLKLLFRIIFTKNNFILLYIDDNKNDISGHIHNISKKEVNEITNHLRKGIK